MGQRDTTQTRLVTKERDMNRPDNTGPWEDGQYYLPDGEPWLMAEHGSSFEDVIRYQGWAVEIANGFIFEMMMGGMQ